MKNLLDFTGRDALRLRSLPFHHRDPFDRMLISQSLETGFPILTQDTVFRSYDCSSPDAGRNSICFHAHTHIPTHANCGLCPPWDMKMG